MGSLNFLKGDAMALPPAQQGFPDQQVSEAICGTDLQ